MTFQEGRGKRFLELFDGWKKHIAAFPGCTSLKLVQDINDPDVFMTISEWNAPADLEAYRHSELFSQVWPIVKPMFREKARAWSVETSYSSGSAE
jgi:quinol monooxygenase YgiN